MTINDQEATSNLTSIKCLPLVLESLCLDLELEGFALLDCHRLGVELLKVASQFNGPMLSTTVELLGRKAAHHHT